MGKRAKALKKIRRIAKKHGFNVNVGGPPPGMEKLAMMGAMAALHHMLEEKADKTPKAAKASFI